MAMFENAGKPTSPPARSAAGRATYLREWVAFHRLVGVERFFLYDNGHRGRAPRGAARRSSRTARWCCTRGRSTRGRGRRTTTASSITAHDARWIAFLDLRRVPVLPHRPAAARGPAQATSAGLGVGVEPASGWAPRSTGPRPAGPACSRTYAHRLDLPRAEPRRSRASSTRPATERRYERALVRSIATAHWQWTSSEQRVRGLGRRRSFTFERAAPQPLLLEVRGGGAAKFTRPQAGTGKLRADADSEEPARAQRALRGARRLRRALARPTLRAELERIEKGE